MDYAKYLGLDVDEDADLIWIGEASLCAPLPKGWAEYTDANGNVYFHRAKEGTSTWEVCRFSLCVRSGGCTEWEACVRIGVG
jgi:hypothetical protein